MKHMLLIPLILLITFSSIEASQLEKVSLQLKWKYQFQFAGFIMAKEKGFYQDIGLDVELIEFDQNTNMMQALRNEKIDFAINDSALIFEAVKGEPVVAIMSLFQSSPYSLMALKSSGIDSIQDIEGKKIALHEDVNGMSISAMLASYQISYIQRPVSYSLDSLISGENDMLSVYLSNEPYVAKEKGIEIVLFNPKDYGIDEYGDILFTSKNLLKNRPEVVEKMYQASKAGWEYAFSHIEETVDVIHNKYNTLNKSKKVLVYEAETLKSLSGYGKNFGHISANKIKNIAHIFGFINIGKKNLNNLNDFIYKPTDRQITTLTTDEKNYLQQQQEIKMCVDPNWMPFEKIDKDGRYIGIISEYIKLFSKQLKINFVLEKTKTYKQSREYLKSGRCQLIATDVATKKVKESFLTTKPYLITPRAFAIHEDTKGVQKFSQIALKGKISVVATTPVESILKEIYPNIEVLSFDTTAKALQSVAAKQSIAFVGPISSISYTIQKNGLLNVNIGGVLKSEIKLSVLINKNHSPLVPILNKAIDTITELEKLEILNKWTKVTYNKEIDYTHFILVVSTSLLIIVILTFFYLKQIKLKKQIEHEKDIFKNIFNRASDGVTILTNGILTDCNDAVVKLLKYNSKKELLHLSPSQLSPKYQDDGQLSLDKSIEMMKIAVENSYHNFQWIHKKADDTEFWCDIMITDISMNDEEQILHAVWRDISKQKELEAEILAVNNGLKQKIKEEIEKNQKQTEQLLQQSRLAQMGEMIGMIAHQWRQPLAAIGAASAAIKIKASLGKLEQNKAVELSTRMSEYAQHLSETIDDFRNFFKPNKEKIETSFDELVQSVLLIVAASIKTKNIEIKQDLGCHDKFTSYPNELKQVILNLIKNSEDILLEKQIENGCINIKSYKDNNAIVLEVSDNAGGIADDILDQIFDPYFSTKKEKDGTGLGLYMSKTIIEKHCKGKLRASNDVDGAIFKIELML